MSDAKRLKALEDKNAKIKKLLGDQMLEASALRELLHEPSVLGVRRQQQSKPILTQDASGK